MTPATLTHTVGSVLRLLPGFASSVRPGKVPVLYDARQALCRDATAGGLDVAAVRESARRLGVLDHEGGGWLGGLVRERLRRSLAARTTLDWERIYPGLRADARAERHIARAARRTAFAGGLSAAGAHVGEAVTILTDGMAVAVCMPAVIASVASEVVASAKMQIDLVVDLASIYGAAFDVSDTAELAAILDLALPAGRAGARPACHAPGCSTEDEIFARIGRALFEDAVLGLVPFVGIPYSAARNYRASRRVGAVARRWIKRRAALREALARMDLRSSPALLLEGAWLLATVDGVATHEELVIIASVARALGCDEHRLRARLDASDERRWLAAIATEGAPERRALLDALVVVAGLRGPTRHPEQRFLARASDALGIAVDFARIQAIHRSLGDGPSVTSN